MTNKIQINNLVKLETKGLWHCFKYITSPLYRSQYKTDRYREQKTLNDLILKGNLLEETSLISRTDSKGRIIYANNKFLEVAGYTLKECIGKDHSLVNSKFHSTKFWQDMYRTTVKERKIWHHPCIVNKNKQGELYFVKSWIQAEFDLNDKLIGFISIRHDITDLIIQQKETEQKNAYLEHAAKILRHDMHSGINTYIPRGVSSLKRRLTKDKIEELRIGAPIRLINDGLIHTQKVYKGVYEFTNLVKPNVKLNKEVKNLGKILRDYLRITSYSKNVIINNLPDENVNESLFCTACDNLIRNGLKYNDSDTKVVKIYFDKSNESIIIEDNGRGITQDQFEELRKPYIRNKNQIESGSGLGLNICCAILEEHGFKVSCEKLKKGTKFKIKLR